MPESRLLFTLVAAMLPAALLLAACASATPTPASTPTPDQPVSADLTQDIVSADGRWLLRTPAGWSVQNLFPSTVIMTDTPDLIAPESTALVPAPGQSVTVLSVLPRSDTDLAIGVSLAEIGGRMVSATTGAGAGSLGAPQTFTLNGSPAASYAGVATLEGVEVGLYLLFVDLAALDVFVNVSVTTAPGEQARYAALMQQIVTTIQPDDSGAEG